MKYKVPNWWQLNSIKCTRGLTWQTPYRGENQGLKYPDRPGGCYGIQIQRAFLLPRRNGQSIIYGIRHPLTRKIVYIGKTHSVTFRFEAHRYSGNRAFKKGSVGEWVKSLNVKFYEPIFVILERVQKKEEWLAEKKWIQHFLKKGKLFNKSNLK